MLLEQRGQRRVTAHLCLVESRAGRVHVRIRIRPVLQQDLRHRHVPRDRALAQRIAPRRYDIVDPLEDAGFISIEAEFEHEAQHVGAT